MDDNTHIYNTWHAFVTAADSTTKHPDNAHHNSAHSGGGLHTSQWSGTDTFEQAIELAQHGWPEGARRIKDNVHIIERFIAPRQPKKDLTYDVRGPGMMDFDKYTQGQPDPWIVFEDRDAQDGTSTAIVPIVFNISASCGVDVETMYRRGAAVCALIDILEHSKIRCEVKLVARINNGGWRIRGQQSSGMHTFICQLKKAEEGMDVDRMAYALCHAATFRRLIFSLMEEHIPQLGSGYGYPDVYKEEGAMNIDDSSLVIRREQDMVPWLVKQLARYGIEVDQSAYATEQA